MIPLVSLIVPVYNGEKYIDFFIQCFEKQNYKNLELLIINDGSSDDTYQIVTRYANADPRIKIYSQENRGPSAARNLGIKKADGEYIIFADIDDYIYPTYVSYLYDILKRNNADVAFCNYRKVTRIDNEVIAINTQKEEGTEQYNREQAIEDFSYRRHLTGYSYLKIIKKEIIKNILFQENIVYGEDFIFTYELLKQCNKVAYGGKIQYLYLQNVASATHQKRDNTKKYQDAWKMHVQYLEDIRVNFPESEWGAISKCYLLAINDVTRVYDNKRDKEFLNELYGFIKENAKNVYKNKNAKKISRLLGLMGMISVKLTCRLCKVLFGVMDKLKITFKRTM